MHGLNTIRALNAQQDAKYQLEQELRDNVKLLKGAPQMTACERQVLHYSEMLLRLMAGGESLDFVARAMGAAIKEDGR